jgi:hypothetical protein
MKTKRRERKELIGESPISSCSSPRSLRRPLIFLCGYRRNIGLTAEVTEDSAEDGRGNLNQGATIGQGSDTSAQ